MMLTLHWHAGVARLRRPSVVRMVEEEVLTSSTTTTSTSQGSASSGPSPELMADLIDRYTDNLMRAAFSLGFAEGEAEELVQATFCAFYEGGARYQKRSLLLTYLFGILYNKARETRRWRDRHESMDAKIDESFASHFDATDHWDDPSMALMTEVEQKAQTSAIEQMLQDCLEGLGALMRMAFTLKEVECLDSKQICLALGISPSNLGVTLFRARTKLRECLTSKGAVII